ncbi:MAG: glycine dehydrogenase subunit 2 [Desulfobulbaceae bacterium]|nr:MAG: glycine dehydrogenase subunit 2 [Desulfobulbaceae bacterium]
MNGTVGASGLILNEPLLWEKGRKGRRGMSMVESGVPPAPIDAGLCDEGPDFPDLSEIDVIRHYTRLSQWNFGIDSGMYPLGSCTMKYNPKINERMAATPEIACAHPMLDDASSQGVLRIMFELQQFLAVITGMDAVSLQPSAGAQGELAGMLIFAAWFRSRGEKRTKILIPDTAHGTNPASAALCGFTPVPLKSGDDGRLAVETVAALMDGETAGIMLTNPNTLGIFESNIRAIAEAVHARGGLVYGDGANMNAIMGIADPRKCGVDVLHLNLHKTFSTPHGGGGPGAGPVCVVQALEQFLPAPRVIRDDSGYRLADGGPSSIGRLHAFHGNFSVLVRAWSYIRSMGPEDLKKASQLAVLNANYVKERLKGTLHLPYDQPSLHECVFSDQFQHDHGIRTLDMAKRLIDYGYHPPTVYFPLVVPGAIMIEPTETECRDDLDQFVEAFKAVVQEAADTPDLLLQAPVRAKLRRLDETRAARHPCLCG